MAWEFHSSTELLLVARRGRQMGKRLKRFVRPLGTLTTSINHPSLAFMKAFIHRKNKYVGNEQLYFTL